MVKQNLEIIDFEDKKTQGGKRYTRFKTSDGWMSCFDVKTSDELKKFEGKTAQVETIQSGEFSNIKKCFGTGDSANEESKEVEVEKPQDEKPASKKPAFNTATMYVSYAKDVYCSLLDRISQSDFDPKNQDLINLMDTALEVINRAKAAFED